MLRASEGFYQKKGGQDNVKYKEPSHLYINIISKFFEFVKI